LTTQTGKQSLLLQNSTICRYVGTFDPDRQAAHVRRL
jgi:hypothetical protein